MSIWTHVVAVLGLAMLCGLWVVLQRMNGPAAEDAGSCGACDCDKKRDAHVLE
ncbi:MAG: hypothetical protein OEV00_03300 [Acidobacteriota bacterium]|nr:hypothetical protein [Acidobacteriota bacterium]MDH3784336.1 hypothetical protein [Acidobacteriota bacterium]